MVTNFYMFEKDILLFTLSVISDILTEPTQLLPVMA